MRATTWLMVWSRLWPSVSMVTAPSGDHERRRGPGAVDGIATRQLLADMPFAGAAGLEATLRRAPAGPFVERDLEVQLQVRVRQHDAADVPTGEDDAAVRVGAADVALDPQQCRADLGHLGHGAHDPVDLGRMQGVRDVGALDQQPADASVAVIDQLEGRDERHQAGHVIRFDAPVRGQPGQPRYSTPVSQKR